MKNFSQFVEGISIASFQAKRLNYVGNGHGDWYNKRTGEFEAKTVGGRLQFYNKRQRLLQQDPHQTPKEKNLSVSTPQNTPPISEQELREKYISGEIFKEGDMVQSLVNEMIGKIIRRGTNHLICVTEDGVMFKSWIKDVTEAYSEKHMTSKMRDENHPNTLIGTDGYVKNVIDKTPGALDYNQDLIIYGKEFINKYRKK